MNLKPSKVDEDKQSRVTAATESITKFIANHNKSRLNEKDLLKMCVDSPKYLSKALGHDTEKEGTGLNSLEEKKEMLKYFYKAWSGLTKFLNSQVN